MTDLLRVDRDDVLIEVGLEFLERAGVPLSIDDMRYGLDRGWVRASTVIVWAARELARGDGDELLLALAKLPVEDAADLRDLLGQLDSPDHIRDPTESARKWLYLLLQAVFDRREDLADPFGVVEQIYCDFEHPPALAPFVRHTPLQPGEVPGLAAILERWSAFLEGEHEVLRGSGGRGGL